MKLSKLFLIGCCFAAVCLLASCGKKEDKKNEDKKRKKLQFLVSFITFQKGQSSM